MVFCEQQRGRNANLCVRIAAAAEEGEKLSKGLQKTFHLLALMLLCHKLWIRWWRKREKYRNRCISVKCCIKAYPWEISKENIPSSTYGLVCIFTFFMLLFCWFHIYFSTYTHVQMDVAVRCIHLITIPFLFLISLQVSRKVFLPFHPQMDFLR